MIEGIDYYPRSKKRKNKKDFVKLLILFFALIAFMTVYYFFYNEKIKILEKSNINLIVIKEPEIKKTKVIPVIKTNKVQSKKSEILEYLDEIIEK